MIRMIFRILALTMAVLAFTSQAQEAFPSRPIKLVLPFPAGGPTDAIARGVARNMETSLGVPVVVENKPGAQGVIAAQAVLMAKPDGYTVLWTTTSLFSTNRLLIKDLPYKVQDFKLVTTLYRAGMVFAVPKGSPYTTIRQFMEAAKKDVKPMIYGTAGPGGVSHFTVEQLAGVDSVQTQMVSYRGDAQMALEMLAGNLPAMIATVATTGEHHKRGNMKILAFTADKRMEAFPDVPTFKESGYPQVESYFWGGAAVAAGTPDAIVTKLRTALHLAMRGPEVKAVFTPDMFPMIGGEREFQDFVDLEFKKWSDIIRERKISLQ